MFHECLIRHGQVSKYELNQETLYRSCMFFNLWFTTLNGPLVTLSRFQLTERSGVIYCWARSSNWSWNLAVNYEAGPMYNKEAFIPQSWNLRKWWTGPVSSGLWRVGFYQLQWLCEAVNCDLFLMLNQHNLFPLYLTFFSVVFICLVWSKTACFRSWEDRLFGEYLKLPNQPTQPWCLNNWMLI